MGKQYVTCPSCIEYAQIRQSVLAPAFVARKRQTGESTQQILDRFMTGVHARHLDGLPILPSEGER